MSLELVHSLQKYHSQLLVKVVYLTEVLCPVIGLFYLCVILQTLLSIVKIHDSGYSLHSIGL